ncbi:hypothetical protein ACFVV7_30740 [Streptomyces globisporus]|uniref:hypothetical protein n=1 Tax=Streptomyces globisporus TaxID=1908 RepID=UPI0036D896ED
MSAPMTPDREQEIRTLDLLELMSDRVAPVISGHLAALLREVDRLRARVAELETQAKPRGRERLAAKSMAEAEATHWKRLGMTPPAPVEDPHDSPLHHSYALGRDLPEVSA